MYSCNDGKKMYKKPWYTCKVVNLTLLLFCCSRCRRRCLSSLFTAAVQVGSSPLSYLFASPTARIPVHSEPKCITERPIRYVTLHFQDRHGAASLRYRNRAKITVHTREQKPYPVWFSCPCKIDRVQCVRFLLLDGRYYKTLNEWSERKN